MYFSFKDVPNVLYRLKIWTAGSAGYAVVIAAVWGFVLLK